MNRTRASQHGYSLIEVVVAIAVAGTTLAGLVHAVGTNLRHAALTHEYTRATALAESMITRVGTELPLQAGTQRGRFDGTFRWQRTIRTDDDPAPAADEPPLQPHEIDVTVWWRDGGRTRQVTLHTMRLKAAGG